MIRAVLLTVILAAPAAAQEASPDSSPNPAPRPDPEARLDGLPEDEGTPPGGETADAEAAVSEEEGREAAPGIWEQLAESEERLAACLTRLDELGAGYEQVEVVKADDPDCGIANPVALSSPAPGVALSTPATLRCDAALAVTLWTQRHLQPAAEALDRGPLVRLDTGPGYTCRRRNNAPDGVLSEHSFGNAIDVLGFSFAEGDPIAVEPREDEGTIAEAFQRTARASSCLYFTTVLGPGTDAAHADHIHADIKERRGGYRLCQ